MGEHSALLSLLLLASSFTPFFPGSSAQTSEWDYFGESTTEYGYDDYGSSEAPLFHLREKALPDTPSPQAQVSTVRGIKNPQERLKAYENAVKIINDIRNPDPVRLQVLADIYKLPELKSLQAKIRSKTLQKIFTPEPDTISNSRHGRNLTVVDGKVGTGDRGTIYPVWKFQQVGDSEYFLIVNSRSAEALGLEPEFAVHPDAKGHGIKATSVGKAASNERYHWKIAYITEPDALIFINHHLDLVLDGNDWGAVYPHTSFGNEFQQWRLL